MKKSLTSKATTPVFTIQDVISHFKQKVLVSDIPFESIWNSIKKIIILNTSNNKTTLIADYFYALQTQAETNSGVKLYPTKKLAEQCDIQCWSQVSGLQLGVVKNINENEIYKNLTGEQQKQVSKSLVNWIYLSVFNRIKQLLKEHDFVEIYLDTLGIIYLEDKKYRHITENTMKFRDRNSTIKGIFSTKILRNSSSILKKTPNINILPPSNFGKLQKKDREYSLSRASSKLSARNNKENFYKSKENWLLSCFSQQPNFQQNLSITNRYVTPDIRIPNDLLAAGTDPLTYDYHHSQLVQNSEQLLEQIFLKPQPAMQRYPGIIDKFARTRACPISVKSTSGSIVIRIGSNYSKWTKNIYIDTKTGNLTYCKNEMTISLGKKQGQEILPANQKEQYQYVLALHANKNSYNRRFHKEAFLELQSSIKRNQQENNHIKDPKIIERYRIFKRYHQYMLYMIPNSHVSALQKSQIDKILWNLKTICQNLGPQAKPIIKKLINQANRQYYTANKKSILDYILKEQAQRKRVGISITFNQVPSWGFNVKKCVLLKQVNEKKNKRKKQLENKLIQFPVCLLQISKLNIKLAATELFKLRQTDKRPVNALYFMKLQQNHVSETINMLNNSWVDKIAKIVEQNININKTPKHQTNSFLSSIHVLMSNTLKQIIYNSLKKLLNFFRKYSFKNKQNQHPALLTLKLGEQNGNIVFADNLKKVFAEEIVELIETMVVQTNKIISVKQYLKQDLHSESFLHGITNKDQFVVETVQEISTIINENIQQIDQHGQHFQQFKIVFQMRQQIGQWMKKNRNMNAVLEKVAQVNELMKKVQAIPYSINCNMVIIECNDIKKKLYNAINIIKSIIFLTTEDTLKKLTHKIQTQIHQYSKDISRDIENTNDFVILSNHLEQIKNVDIFITQADLQQAKNTLLKIYDIGSGFISHQFLKQFYKTTMLYKGMQSKINYHNSRVYAQKLQLQKSLRSKISQFQNLSAVHYREISQQINQFQIRHLYDEYLNKIQQFQGKLKELTATIKSLNKQEQDLKWTVSSFNNITELSTIIQLNYQLWTLVKSYDKHIRQWRSIELHHMNVSQCQNKMKDIQQAIGKTMKKLKNFSGLKIAHDLQNDVKQFLHQQIPIINTFSHPGLKQRHWNLFNKKLSVPGYDLKQIPYGRIKILYEYEKQLKILMSISNQAIKEYTIENQKNQMQEYWAKLKIDVENGEDPYNKIPQRFFEEQLTLIETHIIRIGLLRNSPFSKVLIQMLTQWQTWLQSTKALIQNLQQAQTNILEIRYIFNCDQVQKLVPIQNTQYEAVEGIWKSIMKRISEQSKLIDFCKNQKIAELLHEIVKKIQFIKSGFNNFIDVKRQEYPRLYFIEDNALITHFNEMNQASIEKDGITKFLQNCFIGITKIDYEERQIKSIGSSIDTIQFGTNSNIKKTKHKLMIDIKLLQSQIKRKIKDQIKNLMEILQKQNANKKKWALQQSTLTALQSYRNIMHWFDVRTHLEKNNLIEYQNVLKDILNKFITSENDKTVKSQMQIGQLLNMINNVNYLQKVNNIENPLCSFQYLCCFKYTYDARNDEIDVHIMDRTYKYQYQYYGNQVQVYCPTSEIKKLYMFNLVSSNAILISSTYKNIFTSNLIKQTAKILGIYYVCPTKRYLSSAITATNNSFKSLQSFLQGLISLNGWIIANQEELSQYLQSFKSASSAAFSVINQHLKQLEMARSIRKDHFNYKQNELKLSYNCRFYYLPTPNIRLMGDIHSSYRNYMLVVPHPVVCIQSNLDWANFSSLIMLGQILKCWLPSQRLVDEFYKNFRQQFNKQTFENPNRLSAKIKQFIKCQFPSISQQWMKSILNKINIPHHQKPISKQLMKSQNVVSSISLFEQMTQQLYNAITKDIHQSKYGILLYGACSYKTRLIQKVQSLLKNSQKTISINTDYLINFTLMQLTQSKSLEKYINKITYDFQHIFNQNAKLTQKPDDRNLRKIANNLIGKHNKQQLKKKKSYGKENLYKVIEQSKLIQNSVQEKWLYVDDTIHNEIIQTLHNIKTNHQYHLLVEAESLKDLTPSVIHCLKTKIYVDINKIKLIDLYNEWLCQFKEKVSMQSVLKQLRRQKIKQQDITFIQGLGNIFQKIMQSLQTMKRKQINNLSNVLVDARRVLSLFEIYLQNLNSKQVQMLPQFDSQSFIQNSLAYAFYWGLFATSFSQNQSINFETILRNNINFDLQGDFQDYFLNQENEWINWNCLTQDFNPTTTLQSQRSVTSLWVPTIMNSKFYTMAIKYIEFGKNISVCGNLCGKSIMAKEITGFETQYSSFLIDMNKNISTSKFGQFIKNKTILSEPVQRPYNTKILCIVDDINLAGQQTILELLRNLIDKQKLFNMKGNGQNDYNLTNLRVLQTLNLSSQTNMQKYGRIMRKTELLLVPEMSLKQIDSIFKSYLTNILKSEQSEFNVKFCTNVIQFLHKIFKGVEKKINSHHYRLIIQKIQKVNDIHYDKAKLGSYILYEVYELGRDYLHNEPNLYKTFIKNLFGESSKLLSHNNFGNQAELCKVMDNYLFANIRALSSSNQNGIVTNLEQAMNIFNQILHQKAQHQYIFCTQHHAKFIIRMLNHFRSENSHCIVWSIKHVGIKSLMQMSCLIENINYINLENMKIKDLTLQLFNLLKSTSSDKKQSIIFLPNNEELQEYFFDSLNSIMCSPQLLGLFQEIQIEEMIKALHNEKKIIKKDTKRPELIHKIRQKILNFVHIVINISDSTRQTLQKQYPNMLKKALWLHFSEWPIESLHYAASRIIKQQQNEQTQNTQQIVQWFFKSSKALIQSYPNTQINYTINVIESINTFNIMYQQYLNRQKNLQKSTDIWSHKIKQNSQKIKQMNQELQNEKGKKEYEEKIKQEFVEIISEKNKELSQAKAQFAKIQEKYDEYNNKLSLFRNKKDNAKKQLLQLSEIQKKLKEFITVCHSEQINQHLASVLESNKFNLITKTIYQKYGSKHNIEGLFNIFQNLKSLSILSEQSFTTIDIDEIKEIQQVWKQIKQSIIFTEQQQLYHLGITMRNFIEQNPIQLKSEGYKIIKSLLLKWFELFSTQFIDYTNQQIQETQFKNDNEEVAQIYFEKQNNYREIEDEIEEVQEQVDQKNSSISKIDEDIEELIQRIKQADNISHIFKNLQGLLKCKNSHIKPRDHEFAGSIAIYSLFLIFSYQLDIGFTQLVAILSKKGLIIEDSNNLTYQMKYAKAMKYKEQHIQNIFSFGNQIKFNYLFDENTFEFKMLFAAIQICDLYCVCIDKFSIACSFINKLFKKLGNEPIAQAYFEKTSLQLQFIDGENLKQVSDCLSSGSLIVIKNPSERVIKSLNNVIQKKIVVKDNEILVQLESEVQIHPRSKILFIFQNKEDIPEIMKQPQNWIISINLSKQILCRKLYRIARQELYHSTPIESLVSNYLLKLSEINNIDDKMHAAIQKMRRNADEVDSIFKKIEQISSSKEQLEKQIEKAKQKLINQDNKIRQHNIVCSELSTFYLQNQKYKGYVSLQTFVAMFKQHIKTQGCNTILIAKQEDKLKSMIQSFKNLLANTLYANLRQKIQKIKENLQIQLNISKENYWEKIQQLSSDQNIRIINSFQKQSLLKYYQELLQLILQLLKASKTANVLVFQGQSQGSMYQLINHIFSKLNIPNKQAKIKSNFNMDFLGDQLQFIITTSSKQSDWKDLQKALYFMNSKNIRGSLLVLMPSSGTLCWNLNIETVKFPSIWDSCLQIQNNIASQDKQITKGFISAILHEIYESNCQNLFGCSFNVKLNRCIQFSKSSKQTIFTQPQIKELQSLCQDQ